MQENQHDKAIEIIAQAASAATSAIAQAAEDAARVVANAASEAAIKVSVQNTSSKADHDTLIRIETRMEGIKTDIKDLKDGTAKRIECLETGKLNTCDSYSKLYKKDVETIQIDHENRIRSNEKNITRILTFGTILVILIGLAETLVIKFVH